MKHLIVLLIVAAFIVACVPQSGSPKCGYNYCVSWNTGAWSAKPGIRAYSYEILPTGAVEGVDQSCEPFYVSAAKGMITITEARRSCTSW